MRVDKKNKMNEVFKKKDSGLCIAIILNNVIVCLTIKSKFDLTSLDGRETDLLIISTWYILSLIFANWTIDSTV